MTLIVGILCTDGVVLGSDSAATFGTLGVRTILQPTPKINIIDNCVAVGVSGSVGLSQRITRVVEQLWNDPAKNIRTTHPVDAGVAIRTEIWNKVLNGEIQVAIAANSSVRRDSTEIERLYAALRPFREEKPK